MRLNQCLIVSSALAVGPLLVACGSDDVSSEEDARLAYMGLHDMVD